MDTYDIAYAREHLPELIERAARGEDVSISDPVRGTFKLSPEAANAAASQPGRPILGQWKGKFVVPARLFEPLSEEELAWLSGENSE